MPAPRTPPHLRLPGGEGFDLVFHGAAYGALVILGGLLRRRLPGTRVVRSGLNRDRWRPVNGTFGVSRLIMEGVRPKQVPLSVVEALAAASATCCDSMPADV